MFSGCLEDFSRMFSGGSDGSCGPGGIWWSIQLKVWTLIIQSYSMIPVIQWSPAIWWSSAIQWSPAIWWCPAIRWSPAIWWSIGGMDFDNPKLYGDTSISDGLVSIKTGANVALVYLWVFKCHFKSPEFIDAKKPHFFVLGLHSGSNKRKLM